jgi:hypothetical protein
MVTPPALPRSLARRSDEDDVRDDVEGARGTTMADRARVLEDLCLMAAELTAAQPDPQRVLDWQDPLSPATEALLVRLRQRFARHV